MNYVYNNIFTVFCHLELLTMLALFSIYLILKLQLVLITVKSRKQIPT